MYCSERIVIAVDKDGLACQPASMVFKSLPKEPEMTHICDKLNSY